MGAFAEHKDLLVSSYIGLELELKAEDIPVPPAFQELLSSVVPKALTPGSSFGLSALSTIDYPWGLYFYCSGRLGKDQLDRLTIGLRRRPQSAPPAQIVQLDKAIGGFPTGLHRVVAALEGREHEWTAMLECMAPAKSRMKLRQRKGPEIAGFRLQNEELAYKAGGDEQTTVEITLDHSENAVKSLKIKSHLKLRLNETYFDEVTSKLTTIADPFFYKNDTSPPSAP